MTPPWTSGPLRDYVAWLNENGAPILLLTSGSSEYAYLSERDVWRLTTEIAKANAGRTLFVAATGWWKLTTCADYLKHRRRGRGRRREGAASLRLPD